jgi:hypothetical protein
MTIDGTDGHFNDSAQVPPMADLTPEEFEEEKYVDYFPKLQTAYKRAFDEMNETYNSDLVHGIDQTILAESEPHYEGDGEFTVELPDEPLSRLDGVIATDDQAEQVLDIYVEELKTELRNTFGVGDAATADDEKA